MMRLARIDLLSTLSTPLTHDRKSKIQSSRLCCHDGVEAPRPHKTRVSLGNNTFRSANKLTGFVIGRGRKGGSGGQGGGRGQGVGGASERVVGGGGLADFGRILDHRSKVILSHEENGQSFQPTST